MKKKILLSVVTLLLLTACGSQSYLQSVAVDDSDISEGNIVSEESDSGVILDDKATVFVQVAGCVKYPGVYELSADSRVFEAIDAAGGLTSEADDRDINQAEGLQDGQKIYVYSHDEMASMEVMAIQAEVSDGKVNINTASEDELTSLPGIGAAKARQIVAHRENNGNFSSVDDILNVSGIGQGIFSQIKDLIKI